MRSSAQFTHSPKKKDGFVLGPIIYPDNTVDAVTTRSSRMNTSFLEKSPALEMGDLSFRSSKSIKSTKKSKESNAKRREGKPSKSSKKSKNRIKCEYSDEECPIRREKRKRAQLKELTKIADKDYDKLMVQRASARKTVKEIDSYMGMEQESGDRLMAMKRGRDLKDLRKEIEEWKEKTVMEYGRYRIFRSGDLANRVNSVEKRLDVLEKEAAIERKKTAEAEEKNRVEFNRMKTHSMALEITQIKNRSGAMHLSRMPKELAETTAKNLYKLCSDLHRLTFHLNQKSDIARNVEEALILAEVIAPLYGPKEEFIDSRENTSSTNVSLSNVSVSAPSAAPTSAPSEASSSSVSVNSTERGLVEEKKKTREETKL